ncbi:hypothetical protein [Actinoplanes sp. NPDC049265]|uniref:hypothetical protein n=1 Tax=Actinoplanes sp. NPDC049265 TaxID=3363902 RepID=UPI003718998A
MSEQRGAAAERRVWGALDAGARQALETGLAPTDLQTLLMSVARTRARKVTAARVRKRWGEDRFVRPSSCDPRRLAEVEARLWRLLPERFAGVELSPVAPLGTCSALGPVDQHRVVSTVLGTEVLSDPSNALAVEAARRRREHDRVDLAACHRVLRAQATGPGQSAHFRLFALVSSARTETDMLVDHLGFWQRALPAGAWVTVTPFGDRGLVEQLRERVAVPMVEDPDRRRGYGYYTGLALGLRVQVDGRTVDLGDGGLTTWTAQLLGDRKERCLISCVATERLAEVSR